MPVSITFLIRFFLSIRTFKAYYKLLLSWELGLCKILRLCTKRKKKKIEVTKFCKNSMTVKDTSLLYYLKGLIVIGTIIVPAIMMPWSRIDWQPASRIFVWIFAFHIDMIERIDSSKYLKSICITNINFLERHHHFISHSFSKSNSRLNWF